MKKGTKGQHRTYLWQWGCSLLCVVKHTVSDKDDTLLNTHIHRETHVQMRASTHTILEESENGWQTEFNFDSLWASKPSQQASWIQD